MAALEITHDRSEFDWRAGLPRLSNDRVLLRPLRRSDAPGLYRVVRSSEVARQMWPPPNSVQAFERFIEWTLTEGAAGQYVCFGIVPRGQTKAVGMFELRQLQPRFFRAELGFFLASSWWGTGVFSSAAGLLLNFATDVLRVHRIEARTSIDNARGNAALRKIGAKKEGILRGAFMRDGQYIDQNLWGFLAGRDCCTNAIAAAPTRPAARSA
jgi:ribosomal-protein-alanine N-acetyltransferase